MEKKKKIILLFLIFLLAFVLRFYKLGEIPAGLYQDETAIGYNAYSLLTTGRDEHNQFLPLYFRSFGDYKLPLYIYLTVFPIKIFGLNAFAVRFVSALSGFLTVVLIYFLIDFLIKDGKLAVLTSFLVALNPWHLHYSRATFEVSLTLFLLVLGTLLFSMGLKKKNLLFTGGMLFLVLSLYTYNLARLLVPLLIFLNLFYWKKEIKKLPFKIIGITSLLGIVLLLPFFLTFFREGGYSSASGTLIWSSAVNQAKNLEFRSYLLGPPPLFTSLFFNKVILTSWQYLLNFLNYFSPSFFFTEGSSHGCHGIGSFGLFYPVESLLIILGIIKAYLNQEKLFKFFGLWAVITIGVASLTRESPHATRSFFLILPLELFSAYGLREFWKILWASLVKKGFFFLFLGVTIYSLLFYFVSYYQRFPIAYAKAWRLKDKDLALYLKDNEDRYKKIIIDSESGFIYTSLLFYQNYYPADFQKNTKWSLPDSEGFSFPQSFGKYEFRKIELNKDSQKDYLLVFGGNQLPQDLSPKVVFKYPIRPVAFALKQEIISYPVEEIAYAVFEGQ